MQGKKRDVTGQRFGKLVAIRFDHNKVFSSGNRTEMWLCKCDCGNNAIIKKSHLGVKTNSCGCISRTHGESKEKFYFLWQAVLRRCRNSHAKEYKYYGGRGIKVCKRWLSYENFCADMRVGYREGLQIDRIDNDGNYEPENCRWVTPKQNSRNRSNNRILEFNGQIMCKSAWSEKLGLRLKIIDKRLRLGWPVSRVLTEPVRLQRFSGKSYLNA